LCRDLRPSRRHQINLEKLGSYTSRRQLADDPFDDLPELPDRHSAEPYRVGRLDRRDLCGANVWPW